jgi:hypothetical protein|nr:MAG TPA: hypothetical protein [Caudoviricetes sp.]
MEESPIEVVFYKINEHFDKWLMSDCAKDIDLVFLHNKKNVDLFLKKSKNELTIDDIMFMEHIDDSEDKYQVVKRQEVDMYIMLHEKLLYTVLSKDLLMIGMHDSGITKFGEEFVDNSSVKFSNALIIRRDRPTIEIVDKIIFDIEPDILYTIRRCLHSEERMYEIILNGNEKSKEKWRELLGTSITSSLRDQ